MFESMVGIRRGIGVLTLAVGLACGPAHGLIISTNQNLSDTLSAAGFPYWDNVGWRGLRTWGSDGSSIYLGDSWVLTANHVQAGQVKLGDTIYAPIAGTERQIDGADLLVFRIANPPDLPSVPIREANLIDGSAVRMLGTGRDQVPTKTYWKVYDSGGTIVWDEVPRNQANASGYKWTSAPETRVKRWGTNEITDVYQSNGLHFFKTSFDTVDTTYEASAADKDSGGSVFVNNGGVWELAGIMVGLSYWVGQPNAAVDWVQWSPTSGNETVMVDLTYYRSQILGATPEPEPLQGDLNGDDYISQADLDIVLAQWGQHVTPGVPADPNKDGFVGQIDLDYVLANWGRGTLPPAPEPATMISLLVGSMAILSAPKSRRRA